MTQDSITVVDVAPLLAGGLEGEAVVGRALRRAGRDIGFVRPRPSGPCPASSAPASTPTTAT